MIERSTGNQWVPDLRGDWNLLAFRRVARVDGGLVDPQARRYSEMPLIAPNHVERDTGRLLDVATAAEQGAESGKYLVRRGQVVYSKIRPALNKVVIAPTDCLCSADMYALDGLPGHVDNNFLRYYLLSKPFVAFASDQSMRVSMPKVNREALAEAPIVVPPIDDQRTIADFLDRETAQIDAMVDAQERLVALLEERRGEVILQAVTTGLRGAPVQDADLGWTSHVPKGWDTVRIGLRWGIVAGVSVAGHRSVDGDEDGSPYVRAASIQPHGVDLSTVKRLLFTPAELSSLTLRAGDLLVVEGGQGYGRSAVLRQTLDGWGFQNHVMRVRPTHGDSNFFLDYVLKAVRAAGYIFVLSGHAAMPVFSAEKLAAIRIGLPSHADQAEVVEYLDRTTARIDAMITKTGESIALMKERRAALISAAVTGRIDVRTGVEQVERELEEARA